MTKQLSDEELARIRAQYEAIPKPTDLKIEYDGEALKVVRVGMNHREAWPIIDKIIRMGYHVVGVAGNSNNMNQGFVMLERD